MRNYSPANRPGGTRVRPTEIRARTALDRRHALFSGIAFRNSPIHTATLLVKNGRARRRSGWPASLADGITAHASRRASSFPFSHPSRSTYDSPIHAYCAADRDQRRALPEPVRPYSAWTRVPDIRAARWGVYAPSFVCCDGFRLVAKARNMLAGSSMRKAASCWHSALSVRRFPIFSGRRACDILSRLIRRPALCRHPSNFRGAMAATGIQAFRYRHRYGTGCSPRVRVCSDPIRLPRPLARRHRTPPSRSALLRIRRQFLRVSSLALDHLPHHQTLLFRARRAHRRNQDARREQDERIER